MNRRHFIHATVAAGGLASIPAASTTHADSVMPRALFELRSYTLRPGKQQVLDDHLKHTLIPALNRMDVNPVGVFHETPPAEKPVAHVLIPYERMDQFASVAARLRSDPEFQRASNEYLSALATDPVYERIESSLLLGIEGMPQIKVPAKQPRLFNLRIYESHSEAAAKKKIEMFNQGELAIFKRVGLTPVLFGEALVGTRLPNLTYLLVFDDDKAREQAWGRFRSDPEWLKLKAIPEYEDKKIVSKITNKLLTPAEYSQI
jgi:hypothetical protein